MTTEPEPTPATGEELAEFFEQLAPTALATGTTPRTVAITAANLRALILGAARRTEATLVLRQAAHAINEVLHQPLFEGERFVSTDTLRDCQADMQRAIQQLTEVGIGELDSFTPALT